jgi:signal transduction histidine kinase
VRLTPRLLLGTLVVVGTLGLLVLTLVDRTLHDRLTASATAELEREARLVGEYFSREPDRPDSLAVRVARALKARVTLVDLTGRVIADSELDASALDTLSSGTNRPEIAAALGGRTGNSRRPSTRTGADERFIAVPVPGRGVVRVSRPTEAIDTVLSDARRDLRGAMLLALLGALFAMWLFSRSVSRPLERLAEVARALAGGDLARRPLLRAPGEVGELADALRELAEQLSARRREMDDDEMLLVQLTESLNEAVIAVDTSQMVVRINETGRRLLGTREILPFPLDHLPREVAFRDALQAAFAGETTEGAEVNVAGRTLNLTARPLTGGGAVLALFDLTGVRRLDAVRRDFVANVSHELRTPLTIVGGFAETLVAEDVPLEARQQFAARILSNTRRMQRIVDDLLDLSRIESGGWVPNPQSIDLAAMTADVFAAARDEADRKRLRLTSEIAPEAATIDADATALRQILGNLVDNAVRHTAVGSVVVFSAPYERGTLIGVRDTGCGIAAEHLSRIFERFYRVDEGRSREEGGTGLGLSIVRHLAEAHGGKVTAESRVGVGTTITVRFPSAIGGRH